MAHLRRKYPVRYTDHYVEAERACEILEKRHGVRLSPARLLELAESGDAPCYRYPGHPPLFVTSKVARWARGILVAEQPGRIVPALELGYDTAKDKLHVGLPAELEQFAPSLRELPLSAIQLPAVVYFLVRAKRVVYVGTSAVFISRLLTHIGEKTKRFDRVFYLTVPAERAAAMEAAFIARLRPVYNRALPSGTLLEQAPDLEAWFAAAEGGDDAP